MPGLPASSQELPPSPDSPAPPQAEPQAGIQKLEGVGPVKGSGEMAEGTQSRDRPRCLPLHVQARCRSGSRNHIKVAGAQAGVGGNQGSVQHGDKNPSPHGHHHLQARSRDWWGRPRPALMHDDTENQGSLCLGAENVGWGQ